MNILVNILSFRWYETPPHLQPVELDDLNGASVHCPIVRDVFDGWRLKLQGKVDLLIPARAITRDSIAIGSTVCSFWFTEPLPIQMSFRL